MTRSWDVHKPPEPADMSREKLEAAVTELRFAVRMQTALLQSVRPVLDAMSTHGIERVDEVRVTPEGLLLRCARRGG